MMLKRKQCSAKDCNDSYDDTHKGAFEAYKEGWYFQRNGVSWCPGDIPEWIIEETIRGDDFILPEGLQEWKPPRL
jgi:hypothetical protein